MRSPINTQAVNKLAALKRTPMNALLTQAVAKDQMTAFNMTLLYRAAPPYTQITQTAWGLTLWMGPHFAEGASSEAQTLRTYSVRHNFATARLH